MQKQIFSHANITWSENSTNNSNDPHSKNVTRDKLQKAYTRDKNIAI